MKEPGWTNMSREVMWVFAPIFAWSFGIMVFMFLAQGTIKSTLLLLILLVLAAVIGIYIIAMYAFRDVWPCVYKAFDGTEERTGDRIGGALCKADVTYTRLGPRSMNPFPRWRFEDTFELEPDGLSIVVMGRDDVTVFIGPLYKESRDGVERLKGLVDDALG